METRAHNTDYSGLSWCALVLVVVVYCLTPSRQLVSACYLPEDVPGSIHLVQYIDVIIYIDGAV